MKINIADGSAMQKLFGLEKTVVVAWMVGRVHHQVSPVLKLGDIEYVFEASPECPDFNEKVYLIALGLFTQETIIPSLKEISRKDGQYYRYENEKWLLSDIEGYCVPVLNGYIRTEPGEDEDSTVQRYFGIKHIPSWMIQELTFITVTHLGSEPNTGENVPLSVDPVFGMLNAVKKMFVTQEESDDVRNNNN